MDPDKLADLRARMDYLDDRWTFHVRPESGGSLIRPSTEEVERKLRDLANYTIEIKQILLELLDELAPEEEG